MRSLKLTLWDKVSPADKASWLMQDVPGLPQIGRPGYQFTINADLLKLFPGLKSAF